MAVTKMKLVSIIGKLDRLDEVIEKTCSEGNFQLDQPMSFFSSSTAMVSLNEENPYETSYEKLNEIISLAKLEIVQGTETGPPMTEQQLLETKQYISDIGEKINALQKKRKETEDTLRYLEGAREQFKHFLGLDLDLGEIFKCKYIKVRFGRLPIDSFAKIKDYSENPYIIYFPGASDNNHVWGVYFSPIDVIDETDRIFSSLYFERLRIPNAVGTPSEAIEETKKKTAELEDKLKEIDSQINEIWEKEKVNCSRVLLYLKNRKESFALRKYAAKHGDSFILVGWLAAYDEKKFKKLLGAIDEIDFEIEDPSREPNHTPPVKLKNIKPFRPFEFFINMYGLPGYKEVDPTPFVAITYFLIFGIMFADLGQGIVLALVGWFGMWKMKKLPLGKIIGLCGISSSIFGFLFGSFFGFEDVLNPIWGKIGDSLGITFEHGKPIGAMESMVEIILASVAIGVTLTIVAMLINIYSSIKRKAYGNALFGPNGVAGVIFYSCTIGAVAGQLLTGTKILTLPYVLCLIVLPLAVMAFFEPLSHKLEGKKDWMPKKWGEYAVQTFFELFEYLLSYISNTISFMRIGAFVFVHAGMMMAVMMLAGVQSGQPLSVSSVIILVIGNIIVMGMEGLLVGIQALRLQFYELFSRFFIGDGKAFKPTVLKKTHNSI